MKVTGIVAEYDPMHNGHLYQLQTAKEQFEADCVIVVLGGDFLQRGRPGFFDKRIRTEMAVRSGADLVIQLPYAFSCNSGREYAAGAVSILEGLGCVECMSFGCETENFTLIEKAAEIIPDEEPFAGYIKEYQASGMSYPEAFTRVIADHAGQSAADVLRKPNNLLAAEYVRALRKNASDIRIVPVKRTSFLPSGKVTAGACNPNRKEEDCDREFSSAGDIRKSLRTDGIAGIPDRYIPDCVSEIIRRTYGDILGVGEEQKMLHMLQYRILTSDRSELAEFYTVSEGIEARVKNAVYSCVSMDEIVSEISTRRYTRAHIQRMLTHILMGFRTSDFDRLRGVSYARVLGFSKNGRELLKKIRKTASIPVLSNLYRLDRYDRKVAESINIDCRASDLSMMIRGRYDQIGSEKKYIPYMG